MASLLVIAGAAGVEVKGGLAFLWVGFNFKSLRKSLRLGDLDGVLANASGADLFDLGVR